jgi:hypothetical protein
MPTVVVGTAVEVADHGDIRCPVAAQPPVDRGEPRGLAGSQVVGGLVAGSRLRFEMVDDDVEVLVPAAHGEHRRIAREQPMVPAQRVGVLGVAVVDVALDVHDRAPRRGQQADVDAALVVAVDEHDVPVAVAEHRLVEAQQRGSVLGLDDGEHAGSEVLDDPRGHADRHFVDRLDDELEPADPVASAGGHDLDPGLLPLDHEVAAVLAQDRQLGGGIRLADQAPVAARPRDHLEGLEVAEHLPLVGLAVEASLGGAVEPFEGGELGPSLLPRGGVEHLGAGEQVLDVE